MGIAEGRAFFRALGMEDRVREFSVSSATVDLAAASWGGRSQDRQNALV